MNSVLTLTPTQRAELFTAASQALGIGPVIVEKDFWVCWTLRHLFTLPNLSEHLIFKGGTSLSKIWRAIERFSEDIDVSISRDWLGFGGANDPENATSGKKQRRGLDDLSAACALKTKDELLPRMQERARAALGEAGWSIVVDDADPQTIHFRYPTSFQETLAPYIARAVKIEGGARSDDWPAEAKIMRPYVADAFADRITDADVAVKVLALERTFWEKATILHADAHQPPGTPTKRNYSRHYADLAALADHQLGPAALARDDLRARVVEHKSVFFASTKARYDLAVPGTFRLIPSAEQLAALSADYREMRIMYFGDPRPWTEVVERLRELENAINARPRSP